MNSDTAALMRCDEPSGPNNSSMVARAGVARTFGGLGGFLAIMFLGVGVYLLQEAFSDPLRAQAGGLIAGSFVLALATMLLYFIFSSRPGHLRSRMHRRDRPRPHKQRVASVAPSALPLPNKSSQRAPTEEPGEGLPLPA